MIGTSRSLGWFNFLLPRAKKMRERAAAGFAPEVIEFDYVFLPGRRRRRFALLCWLNR